MPWHVQHHFPVDKCAICITVWADRKVSSAEKKLLLKVPLREASTKSPEQSEAFSHFCRAFDRHFHLVFFFSHAIFFPNRFPLEGSPVKPWPEDDRCHCEWPHPSQDLPVQGVCSQPGGKGPLQHRDQQVRTASVCGMKRQWPGQGKNAACGWRNEVIICAKTGRWRSWDFPPAAGRSWGWGIWGMQEVSRSWERCPHSPEYQWSRILEMMFCSCAKPQQLARAGSQLSPCHGNVTSGIYPDVTEKDGFIIFSFKCIPLLLWTKACCELELQNSWTLNGFFKM